MFARACRGSDVELIKTDKAIDLPQTRDVRHGANVLRRRRVVLDGFDVIQGGPDPGLVEKIKQAFLRLDRSNPDQAKLLDLHRATRYVAVESEDIFQPIEEAGRQGGLIK